MSETGKPEFKSAFSALRPGGETTIAFGFGGRETPWTDTGGEQGARPTRIEFESL
jgi:hypothetical protein